MDSELKILIITHAEDNNALVINTLNNCGRNFTLSVISDNNDYSGILDTFWPDVILFNHPSNCLGVPEVFKTVRGYSPIASFILLVDEADENAAIELLQLGIDDYVFNDRLNRLPYAILNAVEKNKITIEKQKLAKLLVKGERNEIMLGSLLSNVVLLDQNGQIIAANQSWKKFVQQNRPQLKDCGIGSNYIAIAEDAIGIDKNQQPGIAAGVRDVINGVKPVFKTEYRCNFSSKPQWFNLVVTPIAQSKQKGAIAVHIDSTGRKLAAKALMQAEINLSAIIENTTDLVYSLDRDLNFITYNQLFKSTVRHVYGFDVRQGINSLEMVRGHDEAMAQKWSDIYKKALNGETVQFVNEYANDDARVYMSYSINPIRENGEVVGLSCFSRDITRQKMDELALKKSEASLRTIFNNTDMAYLLIDDNLTLVSFNEPAQKYSIEQNGVKMIEGTPILHYFSEERQLVIKELLKRAKNGEVINYQLSFQKNGTEQWFDITWVCIKNREHESIGYLLTNMEITEKKKSEIEREKITADLIKRNKDLEQFTYIISHNLRAPLANIMGLSNLLDDLVPNEIECLEIVNGITISANKLDEVISDLNQVLQVSYLNEKNEHVLLSGLLEDIKRSIGHLIKKEHVTLTYDFTTVDSLFTLKSYLYSIFYNLVTNSIKYRRQEVNPVINIVSGIAKERIVIRYSDNGRGIDTEKHKSDLFGLYKRFDTSVEGKGMGLFMIKKQIESLGGSVTLQSKPGKGTRFDLEFPATQLYSPGCD